MNSRQAADFLDVHEETVRQWIRQGRLPAHRMGGRGRYVLYRDEVEAALKPTTPEPEERQ